MLLTLHVYPWALSVVKIAAVPASLHEHTRFLSLTVSPGECSLVCETEKVPADATHREDDWRCLAVAGPLDFSLTGILANVSAVLAAQKISIFAISSYDTDYILVRAHALDAACAALKEAGHAVEFPDTVAD